MNKMIEGLLKRKLIIFLLTFFIIAAGLGSVISFNRELLPKYDKSIVKVRGYGGGLPPEEIEERVTKPIEKELAGMNAIKEFSSETGTGQVQITIVAYSGKGNEAKDEVTGIVNRLRAGFPKDMEDVTVEEAGNEDSEFLMAVALSGNELSTLYNLANTAIKDRLEGVEGVKKIDINKSNLSNKIQITLDANKLEVYGLTPASVSERLKNLNRNGALGTLTNDSFKTVIEVDSSLHSVQSLKNALIETEVGTVALEDLGTIEDLRGKGDENTSIFRYNGKPFINVMIKKTEGTDVIDAVHRLETEIEKINEEAEGKYKLTVRVEAASFVEHAVNNLSRDVMIGGALAIAIMFLFLRNWRVTLVISTTLPLSVLITFIGMRMLGYSINMVTLISLSLSVGLIVDAAIVVLESIYDFREKGMDLIESIKRGTKEVLKPVLTSQLTIIIVFLPLIFGNLGGEELQPVMATIAFVVTTSIIASTVAALVFVPVFSERFLRKDKKVNLEGKEPWVVTFFAKILAVALRHRWKTVLVAIGLFAVTIVLSGMVKMTSINGIDETRVYAQVFMQKGSSRDFSDRASQTIEEGLKKVTDVKEVFAEVYKDRMVYNIRLLKKSEQTRPQEEVVKDIEATLKSGLGVDRVTVGFGQGEVTPVEIQIRGTDMKVLRDLEEQTAKALMSIDGVKNPRSDFGESSEKLTLKPNMETLADYGVSEDWLKRELGGYLAESVITKMDIEGIELDVTARSNRNALKHPEQLKNIVIETPTGQKIAIDALVDWSYSKSLDTISRKDGERVVTVRAELLGTDISTVAKAWLKKRQDIAIPNGYQIKTAGELQKGSENVSTAAIIFIGALGLIYVVMVAQFNSIKHPFIILLTIPMALVGVVVGLVITGRALHELGMVGIIMLIGIVVSNAILLIDRINLLREREHLPLHQAIIEGTRNRIRPVLMTKLTAILGMTPLALAYSEGSVLEAPLATVVVFGLIFHTVITLVLVPVLYSLFETSMSPWTRWYTWLTRKRSGKKKGAVRNKVAEDSILSE
ncbi:efflux RND transporter permease subunit [Brevibacillus choshinensis]|uniref:efflux RND transporter permease subunit n=1 Tax=Brevibacillus choshinensis TaxID=54911 RepID=UPI002E216D43|nr:efflux RND transporter permease subunit [Brevibacillus choshinensis]